MAVDPTTMFDDPDLLAAARSIEADDLPRLETLVRGRNLSNRRGIKGATLLIFALALKRKNAMRDLLRMGADPNQKSDAGLSPTALAAGADDPALLPILLAGGADPNLRNEREQPILVSAARFKRWENMDRLIQAGADINATSAAGDTAMMSLALMEFYEPVLRLLERGADFSKASKDGATLIRFVQRSRLRPDSPEGQWLSKVKAFLQAHGVQFPVALPQRK